MTDFDDTLSVEGRDRTYGVHVPNAVPSPAPLLIAFHGRGQSGRTFRETTAFDALSDRNGFVVVYPDGYLGSWNDGLGNSPAEQSGIDDVSFVDALVERVCKQTGCRTDSVGIAGFSSGGVLCHRLALQMSDRVAAIAAVAGPMPALFASVTPSHAVSALLIRGTADRVAPFDAAPWKGPRGAMIRRILGPTGRVLSAKETFARWCAIDGCDEISNSQTIPATWRDRTSVKRICANGHGGTTVETWIVHGGGHTWPGGPRRISLGRTTSHFGASEVIWEFVRDHLIPAARRQL